jgi:hypothetical protein
MTEDQSPKNNTPACKMYHPQWMMHSDHTRSLGGITDGAPLSAKEEHCVSFSGAQNMDIVPCEIFVFHLDK